MNALTKMLVLPETSLLETMKKISLGADRAVFVVDHLDKLIGSVTDGDIRRALLSGTSLTTPISKIMFRFPRCVQYSDKSFYKKKKKYVLEDKLPAIPVLDEFNKIKNILHWYDFVEKDQTESS